MKQGPGFDSASPTCGARRGALYGVWLADLRGTAGRQPPAPNIRRAAGDDFPFFSTIVLFSFPWLEVFEKEGSLERMGKVPLEE